MLDYNATSVAARSTRKSYSSGERCRRGLASWRSTTSALAACTLRVVSGQAELEEFKGFFAVPTSSTTTPETEAVQRKISTSTRSAGSRFQSPPARRPEAGGVGTADPRRIDAGPTGKGPNVISRRCVVSDTAFAVCP